jgi:hypothetical protein
VFDNRRQQPVTLLVNVLARVIDTHWKKLKDQQAQLSQEQQPFGKIAYEYLTRRERGIYKFERASAQARAEASYSRPTTDWYYLKSSVISDLFSAVWVVFLTLMGVAAVAGILLNLERIVIEVYRFLSTPEALQLALLYVWPFIIAIVLRLLPGLSQIEAYAGIPNAWEYYQITSSSVARSERQIVLEMAATSDGVGKEEASEDTNDADSDLSDAESVPVPIPPGITEIVLSMDEEVIGEIKAELTDLGTRQTYIFWCCFALFVCCVLTSSLSVLIVGGKAALVAGGAICSVVAAYSYFAQRNARRAWGSLTLYHSYVAELRGTLTVASRLGSPEATMKARRIAWLEFRKGVNAFWLLENKTRSGK